MQAEREYHRKYRGSITSTFSVSYCPREPTGAGRLFGDGADGATAVAEVPEAAQAAGVEIDVVGAVGGVLVWRRAPKVAEVSHADERRPVEIARGWKEDTVAVKFARVAGL